MYWAQALAEQNADTELKEKFSSVASKLSEHESQIVKELNEVQGKAVDIGGYYAPDDTKASAVMRPCQVLNDIIESI